MKSIKFRITGTCPLMLNKSEVWLAMQNAGLRYGIGTYRQCYGRYKIEEIKSK